MHMPAITLAMGLEILLSVLLALTLLYCIVLERRLASVRKGQDGLKRMIGDLNSAIANAGASLRALKMAAGEAAETLDDRLRRARALSDELSLLTNSGERIAQRIDRGVSAPRETFRDSGREMPRDFGREEPRATSSGSAAPLPSGSVMSRLSALKAVR
ncbi:hypothetical protein FHS83_001364 [Rhizomicrobium palustre]|uniref:DUF6468 domain-containing protein n=1 Tax=Rhizomicrobium palustre TaxID=189966 RepID=A0A846MXB2_9PROT|nr:DUF6468 domain-containing protein [Rhizomicrobium palustre]NIK88046.1 hypothetical protein [Rhizomicrobium palustre]